MRQILRMHWNGQMKTRVLLPTNFQMRSTERRTLNVRRTSWKTEKDEWRDARAELGIIQENGEFRLDVWRGSTLLPGYIACVDQKQDLIRRIGSNLQAFRRIGSKTGSMSLLLQSDPSAGKTSLANALARAAGFEILQQDVTQLLHRDDLLSLFDTIATMQANETKPVLVFVDEINAELDGSQVYGTFLTPLEEGVYVRQGRIFSLKPCVWIFVGTNVLDSQQKSSDKFSDFKSRMTMVEKMDFISLKSSVPKKSDFRLLQQCRLEQVYLGATMIRNYFSDVGEISKEILEVFQRLSPEETPAREIRRLAASLENVQYGRVTRENCGRWLQTDWSESKELVKLVF